MTHESILSCRNEYSEQLLWFLRLRNLGKAIDLLMHIGEANNKINPSILPEVIPYIPFGREDTYLFST